MWGKKLQQQNSLLDFLLQVMPDLGVRNLKDLRNKMKTNAHCAKVLFNIWDDETNKIGSKKYKKPMTVSASDVSSLEKEGLVKSNGDNIEITQKGADVIKQMILGDNRSAFEDDGKGIDYRVACASLSPKRKRMQKYASVEEAARRCSNWYQISKSLSNEQQE